VVTACCAEGCNTGKNEGGNAHLNIINGLEPRRLGRGTRRRSSALIRRCSAMLACP
jgi:hypothetical protein